MNGTNVDDYIESRRKTEPEGGTLVHGMTIRELLEEYMTEYPDSSLMEVICYFSGYFGSASSLSIDAGIFLNHLVDAVHDGIIPRERRY